jgi:flagellar biosynthesis/type III secretory pathway M-ring protein FliF/YscJ
MVKVTLKTDNESCKNIVNNLKKISKSNPDLDIEKVTLVDMDGTKQVKKFTDEYKEDKGLKKVVKYLEDAGDSGVSASTKIVKQVAGLNKKRK